MNKCGKLSRKSLTKIKKISLLKRVFLDAETEQCLSLSHKICMLNDFPIPQEGSVWDGVLQSTWKNGLNLLFKKGSKRLLLSKVPLFRVVVNLLINPSSHLFTHSLKKPLLSSYSMSSRTKLRWEADGVDGIGLNTTQFGLMESTFSDLRYVPYGGWSCWKEFKMHCLGIWSSRRTVLFLQNFEVY